MIVLRPDQAALKADIYDAWNGGAKNVMAVLPTGGGKSVILSDIILDAHNLGAVQCVAAHRNELVGQLSSHVARRGIPHKVIASKSAIATIIQEHRKEFGRSFVVPEANCAVASVQTIDSRVELLKQWCKQVDYFHGDEGHHYTAANQFGRVANLFVNAHGLLVTASPRRADRLGLGRSNDGIVDVMVKGPSMRELINIGALCDYQIAIPESDFNIDDADLAPSGDWSTTRMREASKKSHIVGDVVQSYVRWAFGKRGICFATDVETAGEMAQRFNNVGIPTASVSAKTPPDVRNDYIKRFRDGRLWVLVNVDLFGEGFDVPAVEVVIMARPTASLAVYLQQFGRALRVLAGKPFGLVIDHVSNWKRHGFPDKPHSWSLDRGEKRGKKEKDPEEIDLTVCRGTVDNPGCSRPYERCLPACPYCGMTPPLPDPSARTLKQVDGDLTLLTVEICAQMRQDTELESPASVAQRVGQHAGRGAGLHHMNKQMEKFGAQQRLKDAIAQWAGIQRYRGRSDAESYRRFFLTTGVDVLGALHRDHSIAEFVSMAETVEGWCSL